MFSGIYRRSCNGHAGAIRKGMSFWLILFAVQALVMLFAVVRDSGKDARFEGEKLGFRS